MTLDGIAFSRYNKETADPCRLFIVSVKSDAVKRYVSSA